MKLAPIPTDEAERMADVHALGLLDTPREPRFDRLAELIGEVFDVPRVFITLIDTDRMWFKSTFGVDGIDGTPRDVGFCSHAILQPEAMVIADATRRRALRRQPFRQRRLRASLLCRRAPARPYRSSRGRGGPRRHVAPGLRRRPGRAVGEVRRGDRGPDPAVTAAKPVSGSSPLRPRRWLGWRGSRRHHGRCAPITRFTDVYNAAQRRSGASCATRCRQSTWSCRSGGRPAGPSGSGVGGARGMFAG